MNIADKASDLLLKARLERAPLAGLPEDCRPADETAAYAIQAEHVARLCRQLGGRTIGYKVGATGAGARKLLNTDHPFYGRLIDKLAQGSPAKLSPAESRMRVIEAEFAFRMGRDLTPRGKPWTFDEVQGAILTALPAIEVVDSRYAEWTKVGVLSVIADQGSHGHWVQGRETEDWRGLDLAAHKVTLSVDGAVVREGAGRNVLDHPLNAVLWLANTLNETGQTLRAGEYISTGTAIDIYLAKPGETIGADFGVLGKVDLDIAAGERAGQGHVATQEE
ncbi:2-keto-4-pentenoate hydratase [Desertibaculum subflavum]|uniref:2-keto-4-pentenoate hydratase n=1 Tax=Desertibaculum subflavum TaxID=2268458 RepID=UPI000E66C14B